MTMFKEGDLCFVKKITFWRDYNHSRNDSFVLDNEYVIVIDQSNEYKYPIFNQTLFYVKVLSRFGIGYVNVGGLAALNV